MADSMEVPAGEHGVVRVFAIDLPQGEAAGFDKKDLERALGTEIREDRFVDIIDVRSLAGIGLSGYLREGVGVEGQALEADRDKLNDVTGSAAIVLSGAFSGEAATLNPEPPLRHVATYREDRGTPTSPGVGGSERSGEPPTTEVPAKPAPRGRENRTGLALGSLGMAALLVLIIVFIL